MNSGNGWKNPDFHGGKWQASRVLATFKWVNRVQPDSTWFSCDFPVLYFHPPFSSVSYVVNSSASAGTKIDGCPRCSPWIPSVFFSWFLAHQKSPRVLEKNHQRELRMSKTPRNSLGELGGLHLEMTQFRSGGVRFVMTGYPQFSSSISGIFPFRKTKPFWGSRMTMEPPNSHVLEELPVKLGHRSSFAAVKSSHRFAQLYHHSCW